MGKKKSSRNNTRSKATGNNALSSAQTAADVVQDSMVDDHSSATVAAVESMPPAEAPALLSSKSLLDGSDSFAKSPQTSNQDYLHQPPADLMSSSTSFHTENNRSADATLPARQRNSSSTGAGGAAIHPFSERGLLTEPMVKENSKAGVFPQVEANNGQSSGRPLDPERGQVEATTLDWRQDSSPVTPADHQSDENVLANKYTVDHNSRSPFEAFGGARRYEEDDDRLDDDDEHHARQQQLYPGRSYQPYSNQDNEHSPLIRSRSNDSSGGYSSDGNGGRRPPYPARDSEPFQPMTWSEWANKNGLHPRTWNKQTYIKAGLLATMLTLVILSFTVFRVQDHIKDILRYIDQHKRIGAVLFVASYTVACTLFLPGSLFTIGAGFLFKPFPLALLIVLLGDVFAAVGSFIFGRYVFYDWVKGMMSKHPKFNALDQVIQDDGWKIVVMLRLTPIPFNLITYFFSITSIRLWTIVWATCVGVFPGSCLGIWIGSLLKGLSGIDNPELETKNVVILVMNGVFIVCCILTLSLFGKRSLRKAMKRLDQHQAITRMQNVEVVVEGVATVIRELEDQASIPPSFRSTMIEQLAAEEGLSGDDIEAARQRLMMDEPYHHHQEGTSNLSTSSSTVGSSMVGQEDGGRRSFKKTTPTMPGSGSHHHHPLATTALPPPTLPSSGFTRGEKITFAVIAVVAVVNVCVCVPLYYHFASQEDGGGGGGGDGTLL